MIDPSRGNYYYERYLIRAAEKDTEINEYFTKYALDHISVRRWDEIDPALQEADLLLPRA